MGTAGQRKLQMVICKLIWETLLTSAGQESVTIPPSIVLSKVGVLLKILCSLTLITLVSPIGPCLWDPRSHVIFPFLHDRFHTLLSMYRPTMAIELRLVTTFLPFIQCWMTPILIVPYKLVSPLKTTANPARCHHSCFSWLVLRLKQRRVFAKIWFPPSWQRRQCKFHRLQL